MGKKQSISPPRWADRFLSFYCREEFLEEIQGDVHELFLQRLDRKGPTVAKSRFVWDVMRFFRWSNIKHTNRSKLNQLTMVKNNMKIATRSLLKHKFYTGINLVGISLGIACFILTHLYVSEELSFDRFHEKLDDIYRVWIHEVDEDEEYFDGVVPVVMGEPMSSDFPEVEQTVQIWSGVVTYTSEDQLTITNTLSLVGEDFLNVFDFKLLAGDRETALSKMENIVLSESAAIERFGTTDVMGQVVKYQDGDKPLEFVVTGVIEDAPANSSISYTKLISDANNERMMHEQTRTAWYNYSSELYVKLAESADPIALEAKFPDMLKKGQGEEYEEGYMTVHLQPMAEVHFDTKIDGENQPGDLRTVQIMRVVGFIILLLAGINFVNLSVGQSVKRAKEVGVRKVMGAYKRQLIFQFLSESLLLTFMATLLGVGLAALLLPVFNGFADKALTLSMDFALISGLVIAMFTIGLLSGLYPALVLSSFKPVKVLKSSLSLRGGKNRLAYSLIVLQFLVAIFFVSATVIMKNQVSYLSNKDLGFDREAKVYLRMPKPAGKSDGMMNLMGNNMLQAKQFVESLKQLPDIEGLAVANNYFGDEGWMMFGYDGADGKIEKFYYNHVDEEFTRLFKVKMLQGIDFKEGTELDRKMGILVNQAFVDAFGLEDPLNAKIPGKEFGEHKIIGVVDNFHFASLHKRVEPLVMSMNVEPIYKGIAEISINQSSRATVVAKVRLDRMADIRSEVKSLWQERFSEPFELRFIDTKLEQLYEREQRTSDMVTLITILAISIASLGLLGLAALTIKNKLREIGIRKVLGASAGSIFTLLYKIFMSPILVAFIVSVPLTLYVMRDWLQSFAYQISINPLHFLLAAGAILLITLLVVSFQSLRVARANPVDTIRYE